MFNCSEDRNNDVQSIERDSIFPLIQEGRNTSLSIEERRKILEDAHKKVHLTKNDSLKTKYFSRLSLAYLRINDSLRFRETNKETMRLAEKVNDSTVQAEAHWDLAIYLRNAIVLDSSYYHFAQAQKIFQAQEKKGLSGRMLFSMAQIQTDINDYTGSEVKTINAIQLLKPLNEYDHLYNCYNNLGVVTNNLKEYDKAVDYHEEALFYLNKTNLASTLQYSSLNNIGVIYQEKGDHPKAISYFEQILRYDSLLVKNAELYAKVLNNLAYNKFKNRDTVNTFNQLNRALEIRDSIDDFRGLSVSHYNIAEYYVEQQDTISAFAYAEKAKTYAKRSSNNKRLLLTLKLLAKIDSKNNIRHIQDYISLNDSLQQEERKIRNKFARIEFETDEVIEKNVLLAKQQQLWIGISIGLLVLAAFILLSIYQRIRNQKLRFEQQQQASNQEIFDLMLNQKEQIEEGKQAEQKRISEELHDGIVGQMAGIRLMFIGLNKRNDANSVEQREGLIKKLQETEEEVRTISHELNHASYQKIHNFINSIQDLLDSTGNVAGIANSFYYSQETDWDDLSSEIKINIYRIVQESLQNCVKYAKASNILLDFDTNEKGIKIVISDNGVGFDVKKGKRGIGLRNIDSRVKKLDGTWEITSQVGEGTTTIIEIPRKSQEYRVQYPLKKVL